MNEKVRHHLLSNCVVIFLFQNCQFKLDFWDVISARLYCLCIIFRFRLQHVKTPSSPGQCGQCVLYTRMWPLRSPQGQTTMGPGK